MAARNSYGIYLMHSSNGTTYTKLVDIKDYPDLGGTPETLETTTLSDNMTTNILGIQSMDTMEFTCNYEVAKYAALKALEGQADQNFAIYFDSNPTASSSYTPTGDDGKFTWKGELSVYIAGGGTNEVVDMKVSIAASTPVTFTAPSGVGE